MTFLLNRRLNGLPYLLNIAPQAPPPSPVVVTGITLSPATGVANSASGTIVGTLTATTTGGALINPVFSLLTSAGGDFQIVAGNQVAFLPGNVPAGGYSITPQVASANAATFSQTVAVTISAASVTPTGNANRFDVIPDQSAVAPGATATGKLYPNGLWAGGTATLTPTGGSAIALTIPSSGNAPVSYSHTPSAAGEVSFAATNTAGLYNPYPAPLTVFAASTGTARTLAASLTRADMVTYQRDVATGNPAGFSLSWVKGWGEVWLSVSAIAGATSGLFVRLYDALSTGATATAGTGTALHSSPAQVYGAVSATGTVRVLLPAGPYIYYADVATDAAFTNPVRIAQRFRVGVVLGLNTRSQECGMSRDYNDGGTSFTAIYTKAATWCSQDHRYGMSSYNGAVWFLQNSALSNAYPYESGEKSSSAVQEFGRLIESQLGVCVGITGSAEAGGNFDDMVGHDGSLSGGFTGTVGESVGNKFRYYWTDVSDWTGTSPYTSETHAENRTRYLAAVDWIARNYPACAVQGWATGASGQFGSDGSRATGYTRNQAVFLNEIEPTNPMVVSKESYLWNEYAGNHATMGARVDYARPGFRKLMAAELAIMGGLQTSYRGPVLVPTGTLNASARTITLSYTIAAGATLTPIGVIYTNPASTVNGATAQEIASLFAVYLSGGYQGNGQAIRISSATINSGAKTVVLALAGSGGITFADGSTAAMPSALTVHYAADFGASNSTVVPGSARGVMLADDRTGNGIPYGWHMLPALDIAVS